jgi:cbb3-type cytochrome oxidase maturation protein
MSVVYIVLPLALLLAVVALYVFIRAVRGGQFDDLDTPGVRMLQDDDPVRPRGDDSSADAPPET